jgi:hypothetical protein
MYLAVDEALVNQIITDARHSVKGLRLSEDLLTRNDFNPVLGNERNDKKPVLRRLRNGDASKY